MLAVNAIPVRTAAGCARWLTAERDRRVPVRTAANRRLLIAR